MTSDEKKATAIYASWVVAKKIAVENGIDPDMAAGEFLMYAIADLWDGRDQDEFRTWLFGMINELLDGFFHSIGAEGSA